MNENEKRHRNGCGWNGEKRDVLVSFVIDRVPF